MRRKWIFLAPLAILGGLLLIAIGGEAVLQLWNWLVPSILGLRQITFWQALGILALCRILFGGWGGHGGNRHQQTPEGRERFRQAMRTRGGGAPLAGGKGSFNPCGGATAQTATTEVSAVE